MLTATGTEGFKAPEMCLTGYNFYNEKVDIFALGLILCEMCCKFSTNHERIDTINNLKNKGKLPDIVKREYPIES